MRILVLLICLIINLSSASAKKSRYLDLSFQNISDVSTIIIPNRIRNLDLSDNQIIDLSNLVLPDKLKTLDLYDNQISDISVLKLPDNLTRLFLERNTIIDFSSLKDHPSIFFLGIGDMNLDSSFDFDTLSTNITFLSISASDFVSLDLAKYTNLTDLNIKSNVSLDYLQTSLPASLKSIAFGNVTAPDDFTGLVLPEGLETISLFADFLSNEELQTLVLPPNVKKIDLSQNLLTSIDDIEFPDSLRKLNLKKNQFASAEKKKIRKRFRGTKVKVKL